MRKFVADSLTVLGLSLLALGHERSADRVFAFADRWRAERHK